MLNEINWSYNLLCDAQCCTYFALAVCNGWWTYNVFHCGSHSLEAWQENHSSTKPKHPNHLTALFRVSPVRQKMCRISLGRSCCSNPCSDLREHLLFPLAGESPVHLLLPHPCSLTPGSFHCHIFNCSPEPKATESEGKPFHLEGWIQPSRHTYELDFFYMET